MVMSMRVDNKPIARSGTGMYSHGAMLRIVAVIDGPRGCRKHHMVQIPRVILDPRVKLTHIQPVDHRHRLKR